MLQDAKEKEKKGQSEGIERYIKVDKMILVHIKKSQKQQEGIRRKYIGY